MFVLFLEGEELVGAKQNRVLNTSVLIAANSKTRIPVSCVEQGRWAYKTQTFGSGGRHSPSKLRYTLKQSVTRSLKDKLGFCSNQSEVWGRVNEYQAAHRVSSKTDAMADTFKALESRMAEAKQRLKYVDGAAGVAVALGKKVIALELFDKATTCQKVWSRMLSGFILDAIEPQSDTAVAEAQQVEQLLGITSHAKWDPVQPLGEGEHYRAEFDGDHGSALCYQDHLVHGSVIVP